MLCRVAKTTLVYPWYCWVLCLTLPKWYFGVLCLALPNWYFGLSCCVQSWKKKMWNCLSNCLSVFRCLCVQGMHTERFMRERLFFVWLTQHCVRINACMWEGLPEHVKVRMCCFSFPWDVLFVRKYAVCCGRVFIKTLAQRSLNVNIMFCVRLTAKEKPVICSKLPLDSCSLRFVDRELARCNAYFPLLC